MKKVFSKAYWNQRNVELYIGKLLRYGVLASCLITLAGGVLYLYQHHGRLPDYRPVEGKEAFGIADYLREFSTILPRALELDGAAIIQTGVIVLIATPVLRIVFSVVAFLIEKDYLYVGVSLIVLAIILANMIFGLH